MIDRGLELARFFWLRGCYLIAVRFDTFFMALPNANTSVTKKTWFLMCVSGSEHQQKDLTREIQYSGENKQVPLWKHARGAHRRFNDQLYGGNDRIVPAV